MIPSSWPKGKTFKVVSDHLRDKEGNPFAEYADFSFGPSSIYAALGGVPFYPNGEALPGRPNIVGGHSYIFNFCPLTGMLKDGVDEQSDLLRIDRADLPWVRALFQSQMNVDLRVDTHMTRLGAILDQNRTGRDGEGWNPRGHGSEKT